MCEPVRWFEKLVCVGMWLLLFALCCVHTSQTLVPEVKIAFIIAQKEIM